MLRLPVLGTVQVSPESTQPLGRPRQTKRTQEYTKTFLSSQKHLKAPQAKIPLNIFWYSMLLNTNIPEKYLWKPPPKDVVLPSFTDWKWHTCCWHMNISYFLRSRIQLCRISMSDASQARIDLPHKNVIKSGLSALQILFSTEEPEIRLIKARHQQ